MTTTSRLVRVLSMATATAALASVALAVSPASALPPGTAPTAGQTLTVAAGATSSTNFQLSLSAPNNVCPGDGLAGYRWATYMVPASVDAATLTWTASGPSAGSGVFAQPLFSEAGSPQVAKTPGIGTGLITGTPANYNFASVAGLPVPNGEYKVGYACYLAGQTERYWQTLITVSGSTASSFNWVKGVKPAAPVLASPLTVDNQTINGSFSESAADPAISGRTVTAVPQGGGTTVTKSVASAGAFTLNAADGVLNGKVYDVTVTVTNSIGSTVSNTVTSPLVAPPTIAAPAVSTVDGVGKVTVNWTPAVAPGGATLVNHVVTCNSNAGFTGTACAGSPFIVAAGTNTRDITLDPGTYYFRVQANYDEPYIGATSASVTGTANASQVLVQDITVIRPLGALVLTQQCGVMGSAAEYNDPQMGILPAIPATANADPDAAGYWVWSAGGIETLPNGSAPTQGVGGAADPNFTDGKAADVNGPAYDGYPYPVATNGSANAVYPTNCAINLGTARLITNGPNAGQYFATTGRINQLTVINTQDIDGGWTLNGKMSDFTSTSDPSDTFSGNLLGWNPEVTWDSLANLDGYNMEVLAGDVRQPVASSSAAGLGPNGAVNNATQADTTKGTRANSLAKATIEKSLGMAVIDARLRLLIPVTADAGTYTGTLTFTTV
jgi:hypothetical protein